MAANAVARLDALPADLVPLADAARALLDQPAGPSADGVLRLGHRPWVAPESYAITLYPGLPADALARYAGRFGLDVPPVYAAVPGRRQRGVLLRHGPGRGTGIHARHPAAARSPIAPVPRPRFVGDLLGSPSTASYRTGLSGSGTGTIRPEKTSVTSWWVAASSASARAARWSESGAG